MVNPISSSGPTKLGAVADSEVSRNRAPADARSITAPGKGATDSLSLSPGATRLPEGLTGGPPIDRALVDRVSTAIANGSYPIDPTRIAEAIFRDVSDMHG
jgi:flagellar biosynthesis anti-sigma factor FlgM